MIDAHLRITLNRIYTIGEPTEMNTQPTELPIIITLVLEGYDQNKHVGSLEFDPSSTLSIYNLERLASPKYFHASYFIAGLSARRNVMYPGIFNPPH